MSFIGFKVDPKSPKALDGLVAEGELVHLSKAVLVKGNEARISVDQENGESTVVAILDKTHNKMVSLELIFDQSGNKMSIKGDKNAEVHVSGYAEPSGDMMEPLEGESYGMESMDSEEMAAARAELMKLEENEEDGSEDSSSTAPGFIQTQSKVDDDSASSSSEEEVEEKKVEVSESSSSEEEQEDKPQVEVTEASSSSSSDDESSSSESITKEDISKMLASLDLDANMNEDSSDDSSTSEEATEQLVAATNAGSDDSSDSSSEGPAIFKGSNSESSEDSSEDSDNEVNSMEVQRSASEEEEEESKPVKNTKKRQREPSPSSSSSSDEGSSSDSSSSTSSSEPPAKKQKKAATPDEQFEQELTKYLKANGRTPLTVLGTKIKKPVAVKAKLGLFLKARPQLFLIKGNQVESK